jgi:hypothetical protein
MIIWRGWGIAVVGLTFVVLILTELGVERMFSDENYYQARGWPKLVALVLSAALVWLLSNRLDRRPARIVIDKATGQELTLRERDDLFFVPLRYWPAILIVAGIGFAIFG